MRRKIVGIAILAWLAVATTSVRADDREVAQKIIQELKTQRDAGNLKGFTLDMKVENGVVLFRGTVNNAAQHDLVLKSANGIEGITKVVDQIKITGQTPEAVAPVGHSEAAQKGPVIAQAAPKQEESSGFSLREALRSVTPIGFQGGPETNTETAAPIAKVSGTEAATEAATESMSDAEIRDAIVARLGDAKRSGQLTGFGVKVEVNQGVVQLDGRIQQEESRQTLLDIVRQTEGVKQVVEDLQLVTINKASHSQGGLQDVAPMPRQSLPTQAAPARTMKPVAVQDMRGATQRVPMRGQPQPTVMPAANMTMMQAPMGTPMPAYPVPGYPAGCNASGPHYDGPNLPNYAWPGYAAYPNYAALTYPQQYSPSAWPYIGPFYPYPQVPLGWRKVSLEWDDGWWMLDFTDR